MDNNNVSSDFQTLKLELSKLAEHGILFFKVELSIITTVFASYFIARHYLGQLAAVLLTGMLVALIVLTWVKTDTLQSIIRRSHYRERLRYALSQTAKAKHRNKIPYIVKTTLNGFGASYLVRIPSGMSQSDFFSWNDVLAVSLSAFRVGIRPSRKKANLVNLHLVTEDPFESLTKDRDVIEILEESTPRIGRDENGNVVELEMLSNHILAGGVTGSGKSNLQLLSLCHYALQNNADIWLFDGKGVEFTDFETIAKSYVTSDLTRAISALSDVKAEMEKRFGYLRQNGKRKLSAKDHLPMICVFIDELAVYLTGGEKSLQDKFGKILTDLLARGRAAGISVYAATQRPSTDVVPSVLRDNFQYRIAMRTMNPSSSDVILGQGWASLGFSSSEISKGTPGVGLFLSETEEPILFKAFVLTDQDIKIISNKAKIIRGCDAE